jgi:hypothetical protein
MSVQYLARSLQTSPGIPPGHGRPMPAQRRPLSEQRPIRVQGSLSMQIGLTV